MVGLAVFLAVVRASGSAGLAGVAVGGFSLGASLFAPLRGRLLDRCGLRPWLLLLAAGYAAGLLALALLAGGGRPLRWLLPLCALAAGLSAPPLVASLRSLWAKTVEAALLRPAYALTSLVGDLGLVVAPALASLLFVVARWAPLVLCALAALGGAAIATGAAPPQAGATPRGGAGSPLASRPLRTLLAVSVALGGALGLVEVAVPAAATRWHATASAGPLLAAFAAGSIAGGLWFGRRRWRGPAEQRYLLAVLLLALAPPLAARDAAELAPLLLVAGLAYGPATISLFEALDRLAPGQPTEAFTWITAAEAAGTAAGAAASGWASSALGPQAPFALASLTLALAAAAALARRPART